MSQREAKDILVRLEKLPGIELEESCWKKRGDDCEYVMVYFNGKEIGNYDFTRLGFEYSIPEKDFRGSISLTNIDARFIVEEFVENIYQIVYERADKYDRLVDQFEELREIIPKKFQSNDPAKFIQKVREYILCLQFTREEITE